VCREEREREKERERERERARERETKIGEIFLGGFNGGEGLTQRYVACFVCSTFSFRVFRALNIEMISLRIISFLVSCLTPRSK